MSCLNQFKPRISEIFFIISNNRRFSLFKNSTLPAFGRRSLKTAPCLLCARYNAAMPQSMVQKACLRLLKSAGASGGREGGSYGRPDNPGLPGAGLKSPAQRPFHGRKSRPPVSGLRLRLRPETAPPAATANANYAKYKYLQLPLLNDIMSCLYLYILYINRSV